MDNEEISYMFFADIIVGEMSAPSQTQQLNTDIHDLFVDNPKDPNIFVIPYADSAYPSYVIAFHPMAR
jgi:hypothetical protein